MKAITYQKYGGPEVLQISEVEKPTPLDDEILVKVSTVSVNPYDWHYMRGTPKFMRLDSGMFRPKQHILGNDFSGIVESVGQNIKNYKPGDEVFGGSELRAFAEYVTVTEGQLTLKPTHLTLEEAGSLSIAALTAFHSLRDYANLQDGQKILINGSSGGVGIFLVQMAKAYGASVTGVCSSANIDMVRNLGADQVIDYTKDQVGKSGQKFDFIFDAVGNLSVKQMKTLLLENGKSFVIGFGGMGQLLKVLTLGKLGSKKIEMMISKPKPQDYQDLKEFLETHQIKPIIDRKYPLSEMKDAITYLETMRAKGKVIIMIN